MNIDCIQGHEIHFTHGTDRLVVTLHRTLRLPEDGRTHALPPSLGHFPCKRIIDRVMGDDDATDGETALAEEIDAIVPVRPAPERKES